MNRLILALPLVLLSCAASAQQAVVCPPHLDYCYRKPVLPQMKSEDAWAEFKAELQRDLAASEYRQKAAERGLDYQLRRAQFCNSVTGIGC